jgi:signal transduction histidine kinase
MILPLRDDFLSIASHELNTPIASLRMVSRRFERAGEPPLPRHVLEPHEDHLAADPAPGPLVRDLLDVAAIPPGGPMP